MGKRVPKADDRVDIKLKPYERVVQFTSKQMYDDLTERNEIITQGRKLSEEIEEKRAELGKLQAKLSKKDDKVKGYVATKFKPLLAVTEDTREVVLKDGVVNLVIYDRVEEFRLNIEKAHADASNAVSEAKK